MIHLPRTFPKNSFEREKYFLQEGRKAVETQMEKHCSRFDSLITISDSVIVPRNASIVFTELNNTSRSCFEWKQFETQGISCENSYRVT